MKLTVRPLTAERWPDLERLFEAKGCSIARGCWCMAYRENGRQTLPAGLKPAEARRRRLRSLAGADPPPGLIGYRGKVPVGWVSLGPRTDYAKLQRSPVMKPVDDEPVWSVVCFVVPPEFRHQGVATALLQGAIDYACRRGVRLLEAYPIDKAERGRDDWLWHGAKSMYDKAGFVDVARRKPQRPVVRLRLARVPGRLRARAIYVRGTDRTCDRAPKLSAASAPVDAPARPRRRPLGAAAAALAQRSDAGDPCCAMRCWSRQSCPSGL